MNVGDPLPRVRWAVVGVLIALILVGLAATSAPGTIW